jgi:hypothetical protein
VAMDDSLVSPSYHSSFFAIPISALYWLEPRVVFPWLLFPRPIKPSGAMTAWFLHLWCRQEACQRHQACRISWQLRKRFVPLLSRRRRASKEASRRRPIRAWKHHGKLLLEPPGCASFMSIMFYQNPPASNTEFAMVNLKVQIHKKQQKTMLKHTLDICR